ncbi:hypothetical protein OAQ99_00275 [Candidatus Kapabacteria bacterium]|nr:hypothetical protein [Candidatus Kapabacteria bacterium]
MINKAQKEFIQSNLNSDVRSLALKGTDKFILEQIAGRQKASTKLPLFANNFDLVLPSQISLEQCSSESTADYKSSITTGDVAIDMTGGLGIDSIKLADSFNKVIYIEKNKILSDIFRYNINLLNIKNIEIRNQDSLDYLKNTNKVDLIYADPARRSNTRKVFALKDCEPNLVEIFDLIVLKSNKFLFKLSPMLDLSSVSKSLNYNINFHAIKYQNEIKELLTCNFGANYCAVDLDKNILSSYSNKDSNTTFSNEGKYLYEAEPQVLKLGISDKIATENNINKIAPNTYFYLSNESKNINHFSKFEIIKMDGLNKLNLSEIKNTGAIVKSRNYFLGAKEIRIKYKIKEGKDIYYFFFRDINDYGKFAICKRVME